MKTLNELQSIKEIEILENLGVKIEFEPEEEDMQPDFENEEDIKEVERQYNNGNRAAWFCAKVTVKYKGFEESNYLGGCSYRSFKDFTTSDKDYYMDLINEGITAINKEISGYNSTIQKKWNIRKAKNLIAPYGLHIVYSNILHTV